MSTPPDPILILGIGNLLWADEGFGVRCVEAFSARWQVAEHITVLDGGTQGLYLLPYLTAAHRLIIFDAIDYGLPPGTLRQVENADVPRFMGVKKMSLHQTGFQEVLASAELLGRLPQQMLLIGVQPAELDDYGGSLSPAVRARVPEAIELAAERLRAWGVDLHPADTPAAVLNAHALALDGYEAGRPPADQAWRRGDLRFHPNAVR
ncbi:HyaD/HybD family hydrogenase maturation endopeptidase [Zoogloeaceae bacteirum Par-f-2]|jgi:hydrogenase maturation protease|uniref:HyaD/HybD family hydrogenase maturation endopeptidase n=1 Tax=Pseudothauera hydrothermalis TaxID=2184083 RepID=UPI000C79F51F|nr:HyaD/HybD family hydrogenase maturation endopeptidase [Pseudothauera hydrothermalis]AUL98915.1 hydrogenase expression/formation protein [Rhodocyclaceae bacterium]AVZ78145.1 HyaD/HybD family hydrogenase maturation endopeptidase [Zoogloeaceae bacteirum Par-f-2]